MKQKEMRKAINDSIREAFGVDFIELTKRLPDETLFELGKLVGSTDYVVQFFDNKNHPKFYHNREALEKTIRKEWSTSFIDRAERMANHLLKNEFEITRVLQIEKRGRVRRIDGTGKARNRTGYQGDPGAHGNPRQTRRDKSIKGCR